MRETAERIPISVVDVGPEEEALVVEVLRSGRLAQGPMVERLEDRFAQLCQAPHAVAVNSGTSALVASLRALGLGPGDEVITSAFTFVATLNAILEVGAVARFADIDPQTFTIDPGAVEAEIGARTRAIIPVHLYGQPADMASLSALAARHGLVVIEDAAQAHAAEWNGQPVGSTGTACFSFYATKNLATGEGGMIVTSDPALADRLRLLRNQGMRRRYEYELVGHNYRMTDLQAAVALPQLDRLASSTEARRENAGRLTEVLNGLPGVLPPRVAPGRHHVFHQYTVRVTEEAGLSRAALADGLSQAGVETGVYYPKPVYDYDCYRLHPSVRLGDAPEACRAAGEVLSLPVHSSLRPGQVKRIAAALAELLGEPRFG